MEKEEREDREIDNVELDDLTHSDDELLLICFVLHDDVIYCLSKAQNIDPWYMSCNYYPKSNNC